jgi:hypothetical protein
VSRRAISGSGLYEAVARDISGERATIVAALLLVVGGCGVGESGEGIQDISVRDSTGVRIIESRASSVGRTSGWRVEDVPLLEIGEVEGDAPYLFANIGSIVRLSDGRIVVRETRSGEVRYFTSEGRHLLSALGRGDGPEELRSGSGTLMALEGDTLIVSDRLDRVVLDENGRFVRRLTLGVETLGELIGYGSGDGGTWTADGSFIAHLSEPIPAPLAPGPLTRQALHIVRVSADLTQVDTVFAIRDSEYQVTAAGSLATPPFYAAPRFSVTATGQTHVVADGALPEVHRLGEGGRHEIVRWRFEPELITANDVEHWVGSFVARSPAQEQRIRASYAEVDAPAYKPVAAWVVAGRHGEVLLASGHPWDPAFAPVRWSIIDADGEHLGQIDLPSRFEPRDFGVDWILGEWRNELDVPIVRLYRLIREDDDDR